MKKEFSYSSINQLIENSLGGDLHYSFNENNNLLKKGEVAFCLEEEGNQTLSYQVNQGEPVDCIYDEQGRIVTIKEDPNHLNLGYDSISVLPSDIERGADTISSLYGIGGQRVVRTEKRGSGSAKNYFLFEESSLFPFMELDEQGTERIYIHEKGVLLAIESEQVNYVVSDHDKSTRVIIDKEGKRVAQWSYSPYGELSQNVDNNNFTTPYLYNGQYYEDLFQLYQFPYRVYSPTMGLFLLQDPLDQHYSPYVYCDANPIRFQDVDGRMDEAPPPNLLTQGYEAASISIGVQDPSYNCHAYAWTNEQGIAANGLRLGKINSSTLERSPLNNPIRGILDKYVALDFYEPNMVGDRILYFNEYAPEAGMTVRLTHSGIVSGVDAKGNAIEITSKWGKSTIRKHHPRLTPNSYGPSEPIIRGKKLNAPSRRYYRRADLTTPDVRIVSDPLLSTPSTSLIEQTDQQFLTINIRRFHVESNLPIDSLIMPEEPFGEVMARF